MTSEKLSICKSPSLKMNSLNARSPGMPVAQRVDEDLVRNLSHIFLSGEIHSHNCVGFDFPTKRLSEKTPMHYTPDYCGGAGYLLNKVIGKPIHDAIAKLTSPRVIDAGAGYGTAFPLLETMIPSASCIHGVELYKYAVRHGNIAIKRACKDWKLFRGNILEFNFLEYDFIYSYHPMKSTREQWIVDEAVISSMKPGALYLRNYYARQFHDACTTVATGREYASVSTQAGAVTAYIWALYQK
jgi:hypothetical protein